MIQKAKELKALAFEAVHESAKMGRELEKTMTTLSHPLFAMNAPSFIVLKMINRINFLEAERAVFHELAMSYCRDSYRANQVGAAA